MGIAERREREKVERRERILDAAKAIVLAEGFAALTMRKIAERIEYSPAAIYLHFASRDAIAGALVQVGFDELLGYLEAVPSGVDARERLRAIGEAYVAFGAARPATYKLILMEHYSAELIGNAAGAGIPAAARAFGIIAAAMQELIDAGALAELTATRAAELYWSALHGIVSLGLTCATFLSGPPAEMGGDMIAVAIAGLTASGRNLETSARVSSVPENLFPR
jgi:AcrR family transcriptional regulator